MEGERRGIPQNLSLEMAEQLISFFKGASIMKLSCPVYLKAFLAVEGCSEHRVTVTVTGRYKNAALRHFSADVLSSFCF